MYFKFQQGWLLKLYLLIAQIVCCLTYETGRTVSEKMCCHKICCANLHSLEFLKVSFSVCLPKIRHYFKSTGFHDLSSLTQLTLILSILGPSYVGTFRHVMFHHFIIYSSLDAFYLGNNNFTFIAPNFSKAPTFPKPTLDFS